MPRAAARRAAPNGGAREQRVVEGRDTDTDAGRKSRRQDGEGTTRLCAVSRVERPIDELIRFVAGPGGEMVPDLGRKLPGRGVWVTADRPSVAAAVTGKAFARSLKHPVTAPADLAERVEQLMLARLGQALAMANKAGSVVFGFAKIDSELDRGRISALVHGSDAAADGRNKLDRKHVAISAASGRPAPIVDLLTIEQISLAMGRANVVHAGLTQGGATDRVVSEAERARRYRSGFAASA